MKHLLMSYMYYPVRIKTKNGRIIEGDVTSFSSATENVEDFGLEEQDSIDIQQDGYIDGVFENEIESIEITGKREIPEGWEDFFKGIPEPEIVQKEQKVQSHSKIQKSDVTYAGGK